MKTQFLLLFFLGFISFACEKVSEKMPLDYQKEVEVLNTLLKKYEEPAQVFEVPTDKPMKIVGKLGTTIYVDPNDLIGENGQKVGKTIKIELKELHDQEQFLRNGIQTVSEGKLLVSGGAYFIGMSSDNQSLKLKEGRSLKVSFPKISDEKMGLFYGERDSLGRMNWVDQKKELEEEMYDEIIAARDKDDPDYYTKGAEKVIISKDTAFIKKEIKKMVAKGIKFSRKRKTISELIRDAQQREIENKKADSIYAIHAEKISEWEKQDSIVKMRLYETITLNQFGFLNCDRFFEMPNTVHIKIDFIKKNPCRFFWIFKDVNSLVDDWYYPSNEAFFSMYKFPIGYNVRLIAFTVENNKIFTYSSDFKITKDHKILIDLKESNEKELEKLFKIK